jgi:hypothetical protein
MTHEGPIVRDWLEPKTRKRPKIKKSQTSGCKNEALRATSQQPCRRTHFGEKPAPPPKHGAGLSFPVFGFRRPEQKGWAFGLEPETLLKPSDLKQKKRRPAVFRI